MIEVIVKYNGDIFEAGNRVDAEVEVLGVNYAILTIDEGRVNELIGLPQIEYAELPKSLQLMLAMQGQRESCIDNVKSRRGFSLSGKGVIVAIIDSGISYTHRVFRNADGSTRILYIWDQTVDGTPPDGFLSGREFNEEEINAALSSDNPDGLGITDYFSHGTHIASIAAGGRVGDFEGIAYESSIIAVKLGERGRESFARNTEIMRAVKYVIDKAISLNMPVCINLSYGTNDGSHSGNSLFEQYLNDISATHKCCIVAASGNEGYSAHHFSAVLDSNDRVESEFIVAGGNRSLFAAAWKSFNDEMSFEVIAPNGERSGRLYSYNGAFSTVLQQTRLRVYFLQPSPYSILEAAFFELEADEDLNEVRTGSWIIDIESENVTDGRINIWLPVTERVGEGTRFVSPDIFTTLTIPSTAQRVITVGGYNGTTGAVADFSGRGFTADMRVKPDIIAPAVNINGAAGGSSFTPMTGTSMAAPFVTGSAALMMEWGIVNGNDLFLYGERLKAFLQRGARRMENVSYPNPNEGWGKLCTENSLRLAQRFNSNSIIRIMQNENPVYSENYVDVVVNYDSNVQRIIDENDYIRVGHIFGNSFAILYVNENFVNDFFRKIGRNSTFLEPFLLGSAESTALDSAGITRVREQPYLSLRGNGVLIGIIDSGIDYTNPAFVYEDGTSKIACLWDQSIEGNSPVGFGYGSEYSNEDINAALRSNNPLDIVPSYDATGHGTKLASISAGRGTNDFIGAAPDAQLIVVKLKDAKNNLKSRKFVPEDITCYESSDLMMGVEYVTQMARSLEKPVSVIIGLETNEGAHSGTSILEKYISGVGSINGICITCAGGNEADKQHHNSIILTADNQQQDIEIRVDEGESGFPLHIWSYIADKISVSITSPLGEVIERIYPSTNFDQEYNLSLGGSRISIRYFMPVYQTADQLTLINFTAPSPGVWRVRVFADILLVGNVDSYLPISKFIKEGTVFLSPNSDMTLTVPSTAMEISTVGAYNQRDNSIYPPSGRGPTRIGYFLPNYTAPGVDVEAYERNSIAYFTGTSAAAAVAAGAAALLFEWAFIRGNLRLMNSLTVVGYLIRGANRSRNMTYPNVIWGFGTIDLYRTFQNI